MLGRMRIACRGLRSLAAVCLATACATPMTQIGTVSRADVDAEVVKQQQLFIQSSFEQQQRLSNVAAPLLRAAVPLCGNAVTTRMGVHTMNRPAFTPEYQEAARTLGFGDTLEIVQVQSGSPAERVGLAARDRILGVNGSPLPLGDGASKAFQDRLARLDARVSLTILHDSLVRTLSVPRDTVCDYDVTVARKDEVNAWADGSHVYVNSGLLRFITDDDELSAVVGHEIAHNAMHHIDAKKTNALLGGLVGLIFDIAAAKNGIGGTDMTNQMASVAATAFSADFEREADYVGIYVMGAAGRNTVAAANVWRRMAQVAPGSIALTSTHPASAERFVRLDQWQKEIDQRIASGLPLRLAMRNGTVSPALNVAQRSAVTPSATRVAVGKAAAETKPPARNRQAAPVGTAAGLIADQPRDKKAVPATTPPVVSQPPATRSLPVSDDRVAVAIVGAPANDSARISAIGTFNVAKAYFERHEYGKAEEWFRKTLLLDGSMAEYHAGLGAVEMTLAKWAEAEAEYTAASLIDVLNEEYRSRILEARRRRGLEG